MELALNVVWFILVATSYALLFRRFTSCSAEHARGPSRSQCLVALGCVLAILFPVISLTDDLNDMQAAVEETSSSTVIIKRCGVNGQLTPVSNPHQLLYVVSSFRKTIGLVVFRNSAVRLKIHLSSCLCLTTLGRAPPSILSPQSGSQD